MNHSTTAALSEKETERESRNEGANPAPIWVHSSWRVSSTWFWWRFRHIPNAFAYSEIFHESLATLTLEQLAAIKPSGWNSRHPPTAAYFLEYAPLLKMGHNFDPAMSYETFMPTAPDRSITEAEASYVANLIEIAHNVGKIPVLTDVRTLGRIHGLKERFAGCHIMLRRNLFRQWCSYSNQELKGNPYFLERTDVILKHSRHDRFLASLSDMYPAAEVEDLRCARWSNFLRFVMLHLYLYALAVADCDIDIELERLASDPHYRAEIEIAITSATGLAIDLSDCRESIEFSALPMDGQQREIMEAIHVLAKGMPTFLPTWTAREQRLVDLQVAELEQELDRCTFYTRALVHYSSAGLSSLAASREAAVNFADVVAERDRSAKEVAELQAANGMFAEQLDIAQQRATKLELCVEEMDQLRTELAELQTTNASAVEALEDQLASSRTQLASAQAEIERLRTMINELHRSRSWRMTQPLRAVKGLLHQP
jgi:hypothetical protein